MLGRGGNIHWHAHPRSPAPLSYPIARVGEPLMVLFPLDRAALWGHAPQLPSRKELMNMRKAMMTGLLGALACVAVALVPVSNADESGKAKAYVVLVGVSDYADPQIKPR